MTRSAAGLWASGRRNLEAAPRMLAVLAALSHWRFHEMSDEALHRLTYLRTSVHGLA